MEQRLDCEYYVPQHYRLLDALIRSPFQLRRLREVTSHIVDGPFGSAIKAEDYAEEGIPFIRVADVTRGEGTIKTDDLVFITQEAHKEISRSKAVPGDVIIAKTGATMGAASVLPQEIDEANIRGDLALVGSLGNPLHAHYLATYINTSIGYRLFWRLNSGSTRGRVVISNLRRLPVLWPDEAIQQQVVKLIDDGREAKKRKEAEARRLLKTIDEYLLTELGLTLPPEPQNTIATRIFTAQRRKLEQRLDSAFYQMKFLDDLNSIMKSRYPVVSLGRFQGEIFQGVGRKLDDCSEFLLLKVKNIWAYGALDFDDVEHISAAAVVHRKLLRSGDIVSPFIGEAIRQQKFSVFRGESGKFTIDNNTGVIRTDDSRILPDFLEIMLNSTVVTNQLKRRIGGGGVPFLGTHNIKKLEIPTPPRESQYSIVRTVHELRAEAKELRIQAKAELDAAKYHIETILLGEVA